MTKGFIIATLQTADTGGHDHLYPLYYPPVSPAPNKTVLGYLYDPRFQSGVIVNLLGAVQSREEERNISPQLINEGSSDSSMPKGMVNMSTGQQMYSIGNSVFNFYTPTKKRRRVKRTY
jgi:hypothetical protein